MTLKRERGYVNTTTNLYLSHESVECWSCHAHIQQASCPDIPNLLSQSFGLQRASWIELNRVVPDDIVNLITEKSGARIQLLCLCEGRGSGGEGKEGDGKVHNEIKIGTRMNKCDNEYEDLTKEQGNENKK